MSEVKRESNIELMYEALIHKLAHSACMWHNDSMGDRADCINRAIDDGFIYGVDEAYVLAHMYLEGYIKWGKPINWHSIYEVMWNDIYEETLEEWED